MLTLGHTQLTTTSDGVKTFFQDRDICQDTGVNTPDEPRHLGLG